MSNYEAFCVAGVAGFWLGWTLCFASKNWIQKTINDAWYKSKKT